MTKRVILKQRPGAITLVLVLAVTGIVLTALLSMSVIATSQIGQVRDVTESDQTFFAAEGGLNHALHQLITSPGTDNYALTLNGANVVVDIAIDLTDPLRKRRIITSTATLNQKQRQVRVVATTNSMANNLQYAVQTGTGGLHMGNNSEVWGNLSANGPITGGGTVYGNISNSEATLSSSGVTVGSSSNPSPRPQCANGSTTDPNYNNHELRSHNLQNISVFGRAYYQSVSGNVRAGTAGNVNCTNAGNGVSCFGGQADPASTPYPITLQQIAEYKNLADDNTVVGNITINGNTTLSSRKIVGNLVVQSGTLTITGPIWVTGIIDLNHPGNGVRLDPTLGENSSVLLTDQTIDIKNSGQLEGSGNPKSFLLAIALKNDISNWVIQGSNGSNSVIFFAPDGLIDVENGGNLNNATGRRITLGNTSCLQYNPNLAGFSVPAGPPVPISVTPGSWQEQ